MGVLKRAMTKRPLILLLTTFSITLLLQILSVSSNPTPAKKQLQINLHNLQHTCTYDHSLHHKYTLYDSTMSDLSRYHLVGATDYYRSVMLDSLNDQDNRDEMDSAWRCVDPMELPLSPLTIREMDVYYAQDIMNITLGSEDESLLFKDKEGDFVRMAHPLLDVLPMTMSTSNKGITIQLQAFCFKDGSFGLAILSSNETFPFEDLEFLQELNSTFLLNSEGALMFTVDECSDSGYPGLDFYDWLVIGLVILFALVVVVLHITFLMVKVFKVVAVTQPRFEKQIYTSTAD